MAEAYDFNYRTGMIIKDRVTIPVMRHENSDSEKRLKLGYDAATIRKNILQDGRADFQEGYESLSAKDKCLLYAFFNAKFHYAACRMMLEEHRVDLRRMLDEGLTIIDIGCGPATAGLAISDAFPSAKFDYRGVDIAPEMLELGRTLTTDMKRLGAANKSSTFEWAFRWRDLAPVTSPNILVVGSYLFASESLQHELGDLVVYIKELINSVTGSMRLIYTNSTFDVAGENYETFCDGLGVTAAPTKRTVAYLNKEGPRSADFVGQVLSWEGAMR